MKKATYTADRLMSAEAAINDFCDRNGIEFSYEIGVKADDAAETTIHEWGD